MNRGNLSNKAFVDAWNKFGCPEEMCDIDIIHSFLNALMENTNGQFIVDHIAGGNYDNVNAIIYDEPYSIIRWKDFNNFRKQNLNNILSEDDQMTWCVFGYETYDYILCQIQKLRIKKVKDHLFVGVLSHLTNIKEYEKWLYAKNYNIISINEDEDFAIDYSLLEGDPEEQKKHICRVNCLPFYTNLIQPKEDCCHPSSSTQILIMFTQEEINSRLNETAVKLNLIDENDVDSLFDLGNRIRRIIEYFFKYFCAYRNIKLDLTRKYQHTNLGLLKKKIKKYYPNIIIKQRIIDMANELSHDSGVIVTKSEIEEFLSGVVELIETMFNMLLNNR